jgi:hypothetical protein
VYAKNQFAYVYQSGRFTDDAEYWRSRLSEAADIKPRGSGSALRFRLHTQEDFRAFREAWANDLQRSQFSRTSELEAASNEEIDEGD